MRLVLATANRDKVREIAVLLPGFELVPRPDSVPDVAETGATLEENARLKARAVAEAVGGPAVADDTGLEVAALNGAPGVQSARFAGEGATYHENVVKLLARLDGVEDRGARFRTVALVWFPDGREVIGVGVVEGHIADLVRGTGGFGYDPVFVAADGDGRTFAEMTPLEKHAVSHRGRAFRALAEQLAVLSP